MKNLHIFKKGTILESSEYYNFDSDNYTDMSHIVEYGNELYQIVCDSFGNLREPDEEAIPLEEPDDNKNVMNDNLIAGMDSSSGISLSSIFSSVRNMQINDNNNEFY